MEQHVLEKYNLLTDADKKLASMLIDELYHKTSQEKKEDSTILQERIFPLSVWSDEDIKVF